MKWIWILFALAAVSSAISHDDIIKTMIGYFEGLEITEDTNELMVCVRDEIGKSWDSAAEAWKKIEDWDDKTSVLLGLSNTINLVSYSIAMLYPCSKAEIDAISKKIQKIQSNTQEFVQKIMTNIDLVAGLLQDIKASWTTEDFFKVGRVTGALVKWLFLTEQVTLAIY